MAKQKSKIIPAVLLSGAMLMPITQLISPIIANAYQTSTYSTNDYKNLSDEGFKMQSDKGDLSDENCVLDATTIRVVSKSSIIFDLGKKYSVLDGYLSNSNNYCSLKFDFYSDNGTSLGSVTLKPGENLKHFNINVKGTNELKIKIDNVNSDYDYSFIGKITNAILTNSTVVSDAQGLMDALNNCNDVQNIILNNDIKFDDNDIQKLKKIDDLGNKQLQVDKKVNIDGRGKYIDFAGSGSLTLTKDDSTLKNITIQNYGIRGIQVYGSNGVTFDTVNLIGVCDKSKYGIFVNGSGVCINKCSTKDNKYGVYVSTSEKLYSSPKRCFSDVKIDNETKDKITDTNKIMIKNFKNNAKNKVSINNSENITEMDENSVKEQFKLQVNESDQQGSKVYIYSQAK